MKNYKISAVVLLLALAGMLTSCSKQFERVLSPMAYSDSTKSISKTPKVLYLIVDGARGWSVRDAGAANINALTSNAIYSWYSVSDSLANDGNGWADLLTGVNKKKHKVIDNTFAGNNLSQYPTIFKRIKDQRPDIRIATYAASSIFNTNFSANTDQSQLLADDGAVTTAIVNELGNDAASVVVGEFNSVNTAGMQFGYDNSVPQYKSAILQFDQYVGQIMSALKARKNYAKENWLVVVTSNHGGPAAIPPSQNDGTVFSYAPVGTFTIIYNDSYQPKLIDKPFTGNKYAGNFLRIYSNPANSTATQAKSVVAKVTNNNNAYTFGDTTSFTIELKVKKTNRGSATLPNYTYNWPYFFSKTSSKGTGAAGVPGWGIDIENTTWRFCISKVNTARGFVDGGVINDGNWHSLAVVVLNRNFHRYMRAYTDGVFKSETQIPDNWGTIDDPASPLTIGLIPVDINNPFDGYVSDIRMFKAAIPDAVISEYSCNTTIDRSHPYWNYLIGYWPGNDGSGLTIKDYSPANNDFNVTVGTGTTLQWNGLNDIICPPPTTFLSTLVPRNVDLARQVLSWLTISPSDNWQLDGRVWLDQ